MAKKKTTKSTKRRCLKRAKTIKKGQKVGKCLRWANPKKKTTKKRTSRRKKSSKSSNSCRDADGNFVPVPQCTGRRRR